MNWGNQRIWHRWRLTSLFGGPKFGDKRGGDRYSSSNDRGGSRDGGSRFGGSRDGEFSALEVIKRAVLMKKESASQRKKMIALSWTLIFDGGF